MKPRRAAPGKQIPGDTGPTIMTKAPQTLAEALEVIRSMHNDLLAFRSPEFDLITPGREGEFDDRVKAVLAHSAPVFSMTTTTVAATDQTIEAQIQAKGKTAPRVTPADIEANIASEHYFTGNDGVLGEWQYRKDTGEPGTVPPMEVPPASVALLSFCVLVLKNGFTVTGESACASPENFDAEIGRNIARQNAVAKVWPLMGYELRSKLALGEA